jgi:hypothetical protein
MRFIGWAIGAFVVLVAALSFGQTMQPGTNTPLQGCIEGRALRIVNGYPACSTTVSPTVSSCGTGAAMSANATDFVGQVTTGSSLITACTVTFSKLYTSLGCLAQSNTSSSAVAGAPVIGTAGGKTTMTISLTLALTAGRITYSCFPV